MGENLVGDGTSAPAGSRKRSLAASESAQECQRQRQATETIVLNQDGIQQVSSISRPVAAPTNSTSNNIAIDLMDSSDDNDDDEVEVIEVL